MAEKSGRLDKQSANQIMEVDIMSLLPMYKRCPNCKRQFTYNPSVGDMGLVCPHCGKAVVKSAVDKLKSGSKSRKTDN